MALTRANVESLLIRRVGLLFTELSLDGTTVAGSNADLNDPIGYAIRQCGQTVDDPTVVDDADVARVSDTDKLLDIAELRALETAHTAAVGMVTIAVGPRREHLSDMATRLEDLVKRKQETNAAVYGSGQQLLVAGVFDHAFQESNG